MSDPPDDTRLTQLDDLSEAEIRALASEMREELANLQQQNETLLAERVFDLTPLGYLIITVDNIIVTANDTMLDLLQTTRSSLVGTPFLDLLSRQDDRDIYYFHQRRLMKTRTQQIDEIFIEVLGQGPQPRQIVSTLDLSETPPQRILITLIDVQKRKAAEERLRLLNNLTSTLLQSTSASTVFEKTLQYVGRLLQTNYCGIVLLDDSDSTLMSLHPTEAQVQVKRHLDISPDVLPIQAKTDVPLRKPPNLESLPIPNGFYVVLPIRLDDKLTGALFVQRETRGTLSPDEFSLVQDMIRQVGVALRQARLHEHVQQQMSTLENHIRARTRELRQQRDFAEVLLGITQKLNSTLDVNEVLSHILANLRVVVPYDSAAVMMLENGDRGHIVEVDDQTTPAMRQTLQGAEYVLADYPVLAEMVQHQKPVYIANTRTHSTWKPLRHDVLKRSYLGVPILINEKVVGFIHLGKLKVNAFKERDVIRLGAFSAQAAIAIRNAKLFSESQELAMLKERQWLARELHDSISQVLFSARSIAEPLPHIMDQNPERAKALISDLHELMSSAQAEMTTLLYELRPSRLGDTDLQKLLRNLALGTRGIHQIEIDLDLQANPHLSETNKLTLLRISQEAIANITRHADATHISIATYEKDQHLYLTIRDNGCGFTTTPDPAPGHGISNMQERAASIGATLEIASQPGQGTTVIVKIPI